MVETWPHQSKQAQNEYLASLWREHRKTRSFPETAHEAAQMSCDSSLMGDWFHDNHADLYTLTYATGLRLTRIDESSYRQEAEYLTKKEVTQ